MDIFGIEKALLNLKSFFKYYSIFTIVMLSFYAIVFLASIAASLLFK